MQCLFINCITHSTTIATCKDKAKNLLECLNRQQADGAEPGHQLHTEMQPCHKKYVLIHGWAAKMVLLQKPPPNSASRTTQFHQRSTPAELPSKIFFCLSQTTRQLRDTNIFWQNPQWEIVWQWIAFLSATNCHAVQLSEKWQILSEDLERRVPPTGLFFLWFTLLKLKLIPGLHQHKQWFATR